MTRTMLATLTVLLLLGRPTKADEIDNLVTQVSLANLQGHVATLAATPRYSDASQAAAADYIAAQLESYGYTVSRDLVAGDFGLGTSENIVAQLAGTETPERVFIVGAHFDSVESSPGGDDNASGVAGLLEIARVLAGSSFASSIELVAFAHEEIGLLGSQQHANVTWAAGRDVIGMISLEMIGYTCFTPECAVIFPDVLPCFDVQGSVPSELGDWIGVVANADHADLGQLFLDTGARYVPSLLVGWATVLDDGSCFPPARRSDHAPFWDWAFPALLVTDTAEFRNPNYHGVGDVFATLDFSFARQVTQATLATAVASASAVDEPLPAESCTPAPLTGCQTAQPGKSTISFGARPGKPETNTLTWNGTFPAVVPYFGDPTFFSDYRLCGYDEIAGAPLLVVEAGIPAGIAWKPTRKGFKYKDKMGTSDGVRSVMLSAGTDMSISVKATGIALPTLPVAQDQGFTAQLINSLGQCWEARYQTPPRQNTEQKFKDKN